MSDMENCVFCKITRGQAIAEIVYSDEKILALMDIQPVNPGHVLVVPKVHVSGLSDLDEETGGQMFKVAMRVAKGIKKSGLKCEGVNLLLSDGKAAFQEIFHVHLHVIPRFNGDGFGIRFGRQYGVRPEQRGLEEIAQKIKEAMS
jgi:histidine triad (HIT) family protein